MYWFLHLRNRVINLSRDCHVISLPGIIRRQAGALVQGACDRRPWDRQDQHHQEICPSVLLSSLQSHCILQTRRAGGGGFTSVWCDDISCIDMHGVLVVCEYVAMPSSMVSLRPAEVWCFPWLAVDWCGLCTEGTELGQQYHHQTSAVGHSRSGRECD